MFIKEACAKTGLTKKAIEYYEACGLIRPKHEENGYRIYGDAELSVLEQISALRTLDVSVSDIKVILMSSDSNKTFADCRRKLDAKIAKAELQSKWLEELASGLSLETSSEAIRSAFAAYDTIGEGLECAFPGSLGAFMSWHFGQFLGGKIETDEQKKAYQNIVRWLDDLPEMTIPDELLPLLEIPIDTSKATEALNTAMDNPEKWIRDSGKMIESYRKFLNSAEYAASPACRLKELLIEFQRQNGYEEVFLANMEIISPAYREYRRKLREANEMFLNAHPEFT
ncbi:MAG: MerR family transcriptional regulator [Oscillospiraceae bacterium]|nr:MerR family transcriptional regulator [Oscillospiraceae bacterium]